MKKYFASLIFVALFSAAAWAGDALRIMPLGDSLTAGGHYDSQGNHVVDGGYRAALVPMALGVNKNVIFVGTEEEGLPGLPQKHHEGHAGWRVEQIKDNYAAWFDSQKPDVVILIIGTNNLLRGQTVEEAVGHFKDLYDTIKKSHVILFVGSVLPIGDKELDKKARKYDGDIAKIVKKDGAKFWMDLYNKSGISLSDMPDGLHPNSEGYAKMGKYIFGRVAPILRKP